MATTPYKAEITIFGKKYSATGNTAIAAISKLSPNVKKGVAVLRVSKGKKSKDIILPSPQVSRLFALSPMMREVALKNLSLRFDI